MIAATLFILYAYRFPLLEVYLSFHAMLSFSGLPIILFD